MRCSNTSTEIIAAQEYLYQNDTPPLPVPQNILTTLPDEYKQLRNVVTCIRVRNAPDIIPTRTIIQLVQESISTAEIVAPSITSVTAPPQA